MTGKKLSQAFYNVKNSELLRLSQLSEEARRCRSLARHRARVQTAFMGAPRPNGERTKSQ